MSRHRKGDLERLKALTGCANREHQQVVTAGKSMLEHANECGKALLAARKIVPKGWKKYVQGNFDFSYETAKHYARIARTWDKPEVKEARNSGEITSIRSTLNLLKVKDEKKKIQVVDFDPENPSDVRAFLRDMFSEKIESWPIEVLKCFGKHFMYCWDWQMIGFKTVACKELGCDPDEYYLEEMGLLEKKRLRYIEHIPEVRYQKRAKYQMAMQWQKRYFKMYEAEERLRKEKELKFRDKWAKRLNKRKKQHRRHNQQRRHSA